MFEDTLKTLQELARSNQDQAKEIGFAIGLVEFCKRHKLSLRDHVVELAETTETFGFFTVHECAENGDYVRTVNDDSGNPLEVISDALIIERKRK